MWEVIVTDTNGGMLLESFTDDERSAQWKVGEYLSSKDVNLDGVKHIKIERIHIDNEKHYKEALELIAQQQKVASCGYGSQDNTYEVETARTALGLPLDIPEYDNPEYKYMED